MALNYLRQYVKQPSPQRDPVSGEGGDAGDAPSGTWGESANLVSESFWPADHVHGLHALGSLAEITANGLALVTGDPELRYADLSRAVFLDTETTGLNMGTGTYVFLVGAGYIDGDGFRVKQFFLRSPGDEPAFLSALDEFLRQFAVLVTFNGKAFDWPLLENRFIRQRSFRRPPLEDPPHIDLLHPARRLWKRRLDSCALSSLESRILGFQRAEDDVPGWLIPSLYFQFLRSGNGRPLQGVFYHNLHDILSLAALALHVHRVVTDPMCGLVEAGIDFYCLGRTFERGGEGDLAIACYEEALRRDMQRTEGAECTLRLADLYKRERRWEGALPLWDRVVDSGGPAAVQALVERAKYYEHVERDYLEALDAVQHAFRLLDLEPALLAQVDSNELEHRRGRLLNRVYRHRSWTPSRR